MQMDKTEIRRYLDDMHIRVIQSMEKSTGINRAIDPDLFAEDYASTKDVTLKEFKSLLYNNTQYANYDLIKTYVSHLAENLTLDKINVFYDYDDFNHSEYWLLLLIWPLIKDKVVNVFCDYSQIDSTYPLLIIDDCIYSGVRMSFYIRTITDYVHQKSPDRNMEIHVMCLFASTVYSMLIDTQLINDNPKCGPVINRDKLKLTYDVVKTICPFYATHQKHTGIPYEDTLDVIDEYICQSYPETDCSTSICALPLYFDHKIAGVSSSFPVFYNKWIVDKPVSSYL
jgi:hypothetical protein